MDYIELLRQIPQHVQKSQEWLEQRKGYLTSSDAATALGINPYEKPVDLLFKKCGAGKPFTGNIATKWGEKYEDEAISMYSSAIGSNNHEFGLIPLTEVFKLREERGMPVIRYVGSEILAGSPDGIAISATGALVLLEVKCPYRRKIVPGYCPGYYYPQVQLNMYICGLTQADFIEYKPDPVGGDNYTLNIVHYEINEAWLADAVPKIGAFWKSVEYYREHGIETHPEYTKRAYKPPEVVEPMCLIEEDT